MKIEELQYDLPPDLIAQQPAEPRDASRLMVIDRRSETWSHATFRDIANVLDEGDLLVVNNTRVIPAKFAARRQSGALISGLFLSELEAGRWEILAGNTKRVADGEWLAFEGGNGRMQIEERRDRGRCVVSVDPARPALEILETIGATPLPPYIQRQTSPALDDDAVDRERYQTIFASNPGAVAAPTAGLHFTDRVLQRLRERGVRRSEVTLHVGSGTFAPITVEDLADHDMHSEWFEFPEETAREVSRARSQHGRVVAVGTTAVRVLESAGAPEARCHRGWTDLLIYPPYQFKNTDVLLTNFHLPGSTLLALVSAFAGRDLIISAYQEAMRERYRFFSYGDAMIII